MKRLLITLTLLLLPCSAWSAEITSAQDGAWAAGTTWTGGTAPGDGDTAIIATGHDVTVGTNVTVGAAGATGTAAVTVQGTGTLTVDTGSILTVKGDLRRDGRRKRKQVRRTEPEGALLSRGYQGASRGVRPGAQADERGMFLWRRLKRLMRSV